MKKRLTLLIALFFVLSVGHSLAVTTREVVDRVQEQYESISSLTADFTQESTNKMLGQTQITKGRVYFEKAGLMRWEYTASPKDTWVSDGKTLWFYQPEENQVIVENVNPEDGRLFLAFLVGQGNLTQDFNVHRWDEEVDQTKYGYRIELTPKKPHAMMDRLILTIDKKTSYVRRAEFYDAYGNPTLILFKHIRVNRKLPKDLFTFVIPPGTEVIENPGPSGSEAQGTGH
ncbi:MAG: outer membrane lipoprotein chaperone LolA [Proteobacteria bacterium]|nr:outer membrane lipoprotein chaperone LolA [Pseudomonadota bacterium]